MSTSVHRTRRALTRVAVALMLALVAGTAGTTAPAAAQENPYERGPDPTVSILEASDGPFSIDDTNVSSFVSGFGGGTIYYPTDTSQGTFGAVAISPGFTAGQSTVSWIGERVASHGFVAITIDTNSNFDFPDSRGDQLLAALDYLVEDSPVSNRIDPDRLAVMGHSMGGGGTLAAADEDSSLQAAIPLAGWHSTKNWSGVQVPTLVIGAENDSIASVGSHSIPFYESLPSSLDKAYMELAGASHFVVQTPDTMLAKYSVSWLKRFVDNDTRYEPFLCGQPHEDDLGGFGSDISDYRDTCPHDGSSGPGDPDPPDDDCEWWQWWC